MRTYLPTTRNFFPTSSFRIDDSRVGIAESAREDIEVPCNGLRPEISVRQPKRHVTGQIRPSITSTLVQLDVEVSHNYAIHCTKCDDLAFVKCNRASLGRAQFLGLRQFICHTRDFRPSSVL